MFWLQRGLNGLSGKAHIYADDFFPFYLEECFVLKKIGEMFLPQGMFRCKNF
jgi:hypothetical protein